MRFIGITGYPLSVLERQLREAPVPIDTVLSYCHYSMNDTSLTRLLPLLEEKVGREGRRQGRAGSIQVSDSLSCSNLQGVGLINASALSMGLLTKRGPPAWHPATAEIKRVCKEAAVHCERSGVDIAKLAMHFTLHTNPAIPTTLVSTASVPR